MYHFCRGSSRWSGKRGSSYYCYFTDLSLLLLIIIVTVQWEQIFKIHIQKLYKCLIYTNNRYLLFAVWLRLFQTFQLSFPYLFLSVPLYSSPLTDENQFSRVKNFSTVTQSGFKPKPRFDCPQTRLLIFLKCFWSVTYYALLMTNIRFSVEISAKLIILNQEFYI